MSIQNIIRQEGVAGIIEKAYLLFIRFAFTFFYRFRLKVCGSKTVFLGPVEIKGGKNIAIGNNVVIERNVHLCAVNGEIEIGNDCYLGKNVVLATEGKIRIGNKVKIQQRSFVTGRGVEIDDNVWISHDSEVGGSQLKIGKDVIISPYVFITDTDHERNSETGEANLKHGITKPIQIERSAWICHGSSILKGFTIGEGATVAARAVVTKDVQSHTVVAGIPAKPINQ